MQGGDDQAQRARMQDCIKGLTSASGFLRRHLAKVLTTRHIPTLSFKEDRGFVNSFRVQELLNQISHTPAGTESKTESDTDSETESNSDSE